MSPSVLEEEIRLTRDRVRELSYQLEHPPENQKVPIDYEKIRSMVSDIERAQNEYCRLKEEYLLKYQIHDINVRALEHQASISKEAQLIHLRKAA
jgi:hypothetical protein